MKKGEITLLAGILLLGAFLRFWWISDFPPGLYPDEAMNGSNALEALSTGEFKWFYPENNGREGFFINIQALSVWLFGNVPWALRVVSALFGTLTILGVYLLTKELFKKNRESGISQPSADSERNRNQEKLIYNSKIIIHNSGLVALLSSFFLAANYWHVNFSRIGFRAISVPFFATFGLYFLLKGLRLGKISDLAFAGIFIGLGFHTYIAFRFIPLVIAIPLIWYLWKWYQSKIKSCIPCSAILFLFITFVIALPMGYYFLNHPEDFLGRSSQVSIFSAESPMKEFIKSNVLTLGMYIVHGDCNWRHNYNCKSALHPLAAIAFVIGITAALAQTIRALRKKQKNKDEPEQFRMGIILLLVWFLVMSLPATLTREGLPHALRAIGTIPPVMILAGFGAASLYHALINWLEKKKTETRDREKQLYRIQRELSFLLAIIFLVIPLATYRDYFFRWAQNPNTYWAFATDFAHLGQYLTTLSPDVKKYVIVNVSGVPVRGIPMPAQTVMFLTDTFREGGRKMHNVEYLIPETITPDLFSKIGTDEKITIAFLDGNNTELITKIQKQNQNLKIWIPEDFVTLKNF